MSHLLDLNWWSYLKIVGPQLVVIIFVAAIIIFFAKKFNAAVPFLRTLTVFTLLHRALFALNEFTFEADVKSVVGELAWATYIGIGVLIAIVHAIPRPKK